eukprot:3939800-Rhodomonas_salina.1
MVHVPTPTAAQPMASVEKSILCARRRLCRLISLVLICSLLPQAEHHERELSDIEGVWFFKEPNNERSGVLTTSDSKHLMCAMTNSMLREVSARVRACVHVPGCLLTPPLRRGGCMCSSGSSRATT